MFHVTVSCFFASVLLVSAQQIDIKVDPTIETVSGASWANAPPVALNSSICYRYVGCYNSYPPFDNTAGVLPNPLSRIGTVFLLYTPKKPGVGQQLDYKDGGSSLRNSDFNPMYPTKFVIHGFTQDEREKWVHQMKDALLTTGPLNVIIVGWGKGAAAPDYPKAVANTRVVGMQVKLMVDLLVEEGMDLARIHLIGHSLGAQISGYVGRDLKGQVGRISGMDPAGPLYEKQHIDVRLDPTDALFVDVIHSNAKPLVDMGAGMFTPCGHVDFYPNGGQDQPGCPDPIKGAIGKILTFNWMEAFSDVSCGHSRSHQLFIESIPNGNHCSLRGVPCKSWEDYENGKCADCGEHGCSELGYHSIEYTSRGTFYLYTKGFKTAMAPKGESFCGLTYDILVSPSRGSQNVKGKITLKIQGKSDRISTSFQGDGDTLNADSKIIIVDYHEMGEPVSIELTYVKHKGSFFFSMGAGTDEWAVDYITLEHNDKKYKFCDRGVTRVKTGKSITLSRC